MSFENISGNTFIETSKHREKKKNLLRHSKMGKRGEEKEVGAKGNLIVYINVTRNNPCSVPTDGTYTPKQTMMA